MVQPFQFPSSRAIQSPGVHSQDTLAVVALADRTLKAHVAQALADQGIRVVLVSTHLALKATLETNPPSLLIVDLALGKGQGLKALQSALAANPSLHVLGIASQKSAARVVDAFRAGAKDVLLRPLTAQAIARSIAAAVAQLPGHTPAAQSTPGADRLLSPTGIDLYNLPKVPTVDHTLSPLARRFSARVGDDLDLEALIRHTLQMVLEVTGPTNAAVFLPGSDDQHTLGGYINHDFSRDNGQMVLEHLADVLGPKITSASHTLSFPDTHSLEAWAGDDAGYLGDSHVIAIPARHHAEGIAGLIFFRDQDKGFTQAQTDGLTELTTLFSARLAKLIRIHHRHWDY
jgi:DNA-binding response OmpR family regulator